MAESNLPGNSDQGGPYISEALFCDTVIEGKDGVPSYIRVVDRITITGAQTAAREIATLPPLQLTAVIGFKSGKARGSHQLSIQMERPSGLKGDKITLPIFFEESEDRGARVIVRMGLPAGDEGLYWFDVKLDERFITRLPLRVIHQTISTG